MHPATKPPFQYFGGKINTAAAIAALLPAHGHYVEPYAGSLSVLFAKAPSRHETVNDLDKAVVNFWRVLRDQPGELARVCALTPHSRVEFELSDALDDPDAAPIERARRLWVRLNQGRSGRLSRSGWRHYIAPASSVGLPGYLDGYVDRMAPAVERLHNVTLDCRPALDVIRKFGACPDVLLYVDPPYLGSTRGSYDKSYRHEMRDETQHRELAEALRACSAAVVLSGYPSDLYDRELFADWDRHTIAASTGMAGTDHNRTEVLWSNRPLGLHPGLLPADAFR